MSDPDVKVPLPDLEGNNGAMPSGEDMALGSSESEPINRSAADLEAVFDVPVKVSAVLAEMGGATMTSELQ